MREEATGCSKVKSYGMSACSSQTQTYFRLSPGRPEILVRLRWKAFSSGRVYPFVDSY